MTNEAIQYRSGAFMTTSTLPSEFSSTNSHSDWFERAMKAANGLHKGVVGVTEAYTGARIGADGHEDGLPQPFSRIQVRGGHVDQKLGPIHPLARRSSTAFRPLSTAQGPCWQDMDVRRPLA